MNNASAQPSVRNANTTLATTEPAHAPAASAPPRTSIYDSNIVLNAINPHHDEAGALPPVNTGKDAWLFFFSAFVMDILVWGTSLTTHARSAFALTPPRFSLRLRHLPRIRLLASTLRGQAKHCHRWYLRFGTHVPFFTAGLWHTWVVSYVEKALYHDRSYHYVFVSGTKLAKHDSSASDREPGCVLRDRRCFVL